MSKQTFKISIKDADECYCEIDGDTYHIDDEYNGWMIVTKLPKYYRKNVRAKYSVRW